MLSIFRERRFQKGLLNTVVLIVLLASFLTGSLPSAQAQGAPALFGDAGVAADANNPAYVLRSRYVDVNLGALLDGNGNALAVSQLPKISLNLFQDVSYTGVVQNVQTVGDTTSWTGTLKEVADGYFYMVAVDGTFAAHIASTDGIYEVSTAGAHYKVIKINQSKFIDEPPGAQMPSPGKVVTAAELGPTADSGAVIDVMVIYTSAARAAEGGTAAMKARIALAITETNTAYAHAGITPRLRLVHVQEVTYAESGDLFTDLPRFANGTAPFNNVHGLRNKYGADMVSLIVNNGGAYCGLADAIMATASTAYDVVARDCMTGYYSFGHEFGHLQGARHDMYVDSHLSPYAYGHGYVHLGGSSATRWRTIMAYDNKCNANGYSCTRLQYFSNNTKTYGGAALGDATRAHNYTVLNNTRVTVANFRTQVIAGNFNSNFNGSASGWAPVTGSWGATSANYYGHGVGAGLGGSAKHTGKYGDLTYTVRMSRGAASSTSSNRIIIRGNPGHIVSASGASKWWGPSYVFQYSNDGYFSVYYMNSTGTPTALKYWTLSSKIVKGYNWNLLKVVAVGSSLKFYINNSLVWSGSNSALQTGQVGVGYAAQSSTDWLYVDYAVLSNTPTADINPNADVAPGVEVPGGTFDKAP